MILERHLTLTASTNMKMRMRFPRRDDVLYASALVAILPLRSVATSFAISASLDGLEKSLNVRYAGRK